MQQQDIPQNLKTFNIVFPPEAANLPVHYVNALNITVGPSEFFMTIGTVTPPEVKSLEDLQAIDQVTAQPVLRMAVSPLVMKQFIDLMAQQFEQYTRLTQVQAQTSREDEEGSNEDE